MVELQATHKCLERQAMFIRSLFIASVISLGLTAPAAAQDQAPSLSMSAIAQPAEAPALEFDPAQNLFTAPSGTAGGLAKWSVIFSYALNDCTGCGVFLDVEGSSGANDVLGTVDVLAILGVDVANDVEWNMLSAPLSGLSGFDPSFEGSFDFLLRIVGWTVPGEARPVEMTVDVVADNGGTVPEPGTLALIGLALVSAGIARRKALRS